MLLACAAIALTRIAEESEWVEEASEWIVLYIYGLHLGVLNIFDMHYGRQQANLAHECGDFILRRSDGVYAYQLAVVIDDALMGVNQVVRGCDLLSSTPVQLYLYRLLNLTPPSFCHIPLLTDAAGRRLSKRDGDLEIAALRQHFGSPEPIIGLLAYLAGQLPKPEPLTAELLPLFRPEAVPHDNIVVPQLLELRRQ